MPKSNATTIEHGTPKRIRVFPLHRLAPATFVHGCSTPAAPPSGGDVKEPEFKLGDWLQTQGDAGEPVALDGKAMRGTRSQGQAERWMAAYGHHGTSVTSS